MGKLWDHFTPNTFLLTKKMRATNPVFADWLLDVGNGLTGPTIDLLANQIRVLSATRALNQAPIGNALNCRTIEPI